LTIILGACAFVNKECRGKNYVEVIGNELIVNEEPLGTHESKYNFIISLRNFSSDTLGIILSNFRTIFTIPNTPIKSPCEPNENEIGFYLEKEDIKLALLIRSSSSLIFYPNSDTSLYFMVYDSSMYDFDEEQLKEISEEGTIIYQSPCESIFEDYFSSNIKWMKDIRVVD